MKKKLMLLLLPLTLLCGCNSANSIEKRKYLKGEEAAPIKQELSNKLKTAAENFSMKGIEENLEFSLSGSATSLVEDSSTSTSSTVTTKFSASMTESTKAVFDENELRSATPDYAKVAKLDSKIGLNFNLSSVAENIPVSIGGKCDIRVKYGYSTIKPVDSDTPISSDFLFVKTTATMTEGEDSRTATSGALGNGLADSLVTAIKNQKPDSTTGATDTTGVTITEEDLNLVLESLKDYIGYAKSKNKYYISFDLTGLNSLIQPAQGASVSFKGNIYAEIDFSKEDKINGFHLEVKDVSLSMSMAEAEIVALNVSLNGKCSIKEFNGDVAAPTQAEVDALGYHKISKIEIVM